MEIIKLLLITVISSVLFGQIVRLPIFSDSGAVTFSDFVVFFLDSLFVFFALMQKRSLRFPKHLILPLALFSLSAFASTIFASNFFTMSEILIASLFLVRFVIYAFLAVVVYNIIKKNEIFSWVKIILIIGLVFTLLGFLQFTIFPDLTFLTAYGWDPHIKRIVSTLLDPNFTGMVIAILISFSLTSYLFNKNFYYLILTIFFSIALIFTFSRSSYIALLIVLFILGLFKSPKLLLIIFPAFFLVFSSIPKVRTRVIGALTLDETAKARVESWQKAIQIMRQNIPFGVGFNTYRYTQARYGFFDPNNPLGGHSGAGSDSSILLVAATTGLIGLTFYLYLLISIVKIFWEKAGSSILHLASLASISALIVHSQFVNSLFFPQIMILMWFMVGLASINDH